MKSILIVSVYYPPCQLIGAKRPHKIAKVLDDSGWKVTVLTVRPELTPPLGAQEANDGAIEIVRTKAHVPYIKLQNRLSSARRHNNAKTSNTRSTNYEKSTFGRQITGASKKIVRQLLTRRAYIDRWQGWKKHAFREIKKRQTKFDVVLCTVPPFSVAPLGAQLAEFYGAKLIIDYRDPWTDLPAELSSLDEISRRKTEHNKGIEDKCLKSSNLIFTVSPAISQMLGRRVDTKILTLPQGFSGPIVKREFSRQPLYLLYAGSLAYGRDLSTVFLAIRSIAENNDNNVKLVYCGPHGEMAYKQAVAADATSLADIRGSVPEDNVTELARASLCNLVVISPGYEYAYPGKIFDLIPAGRPVYVVSSDSSEAGKLVEKYRIGQSFVGNCTKSLGDALLKELGSVFDSPANIDQLSVNFLYKKILVEEVGKLLH